MGRAAIRHYAYQPANLRIAFVSSSTLQAQPISQYLRRPVLFSNRPGVSFFPMLLVTQHTQAFTVDQFPDCAPAAVWAPYLGGRGRDWLRAATCRVPAPSTTRGRRSVAPSPRAGTSSHSVQNIANIVCRKLRTRQVDGCSECVSMFHVSTVTTDQLSPSPPSAV